MAVAVLRADDLEGQRVRRRWAFLLDEGAIRVARAADERPEPPVLADERSFAALRADLALARLRRCLVAGQWSRFLVLREQRAGKEAAVPAEADDHRVSERADLVGRLRREVGPLEGLALLVDAIAERPVEGPEERDPGSFAAGDLVELFLHPGGELHVDVIAKVLDEQVGDDSGDDFRMEPPVLDADIAAIGDRRDGRGVCRRPADAVLLERLDQGRLGEARRRLREVLAGRDIDDGRRGPFRERGQSLLLVVLGRAVVAALRVDPGEAVEERPCGTRPQLIRAGRKLDRRRLHLLGRHLAGDCPLPDEPVQTQLLGLERTRQGVRVAPEARRADRLVGLLGALRLRLVDTAPGHRVRLAKPVANHVAGLAHRHPGDRSRVRSHVGDEPDVAVGRVDALVEPLRDRHRPFRAEAQLAARLLLEGRGGERRRRTPRQLAGPDLRDDRLQVAKGGGMTLGGLAVADVERGAVDPDHLGRERRPVVRREQRLEGPVLASCERLDLALPLDNEPDCDRLDPAGRQARADLS